MSLEDTSLADIIGGHTTEIAVQSAAAGVDPSVTADILRRFDAWLRGGRQTSATLLNVPSLAAALSCLQAAQTALMDLVSQLLENAPDRRAHATMAIAEFVMSEAATCARGLTARDEPYRAAVLNDRMVLSDLAGTIPGIVWEFTGLLGDPDCFVRYVSPHAVDMLGYPLGDWLTIPNFVLSIMHPEDRENVTRYAGDPPADGRPLSAQYRVVASDGTWVWVESHAVAILDEAGRPAGMRGVTVDISQWKAVEAALAASEEKHRRIFTDAPIGIFQSTPEGRLLEVNDTAVRMFRFPSAKAMLARVTDIPATIFVRPEERARAVQDALESPGFVRHEVTYRRADGTSFLANLYLRARREPVNGSCILEGYVGDITERRAAENALRQSEAKYRQLVETLQEGVIRISTDAEITFANAKMAEMLGYAPEEMLGRNLYSIVASNSVVPMQERLSRLWRGVAERYDVELLRKDGEIVFAAVSATPWVDEGGNTSGGLASVTDISDRRRAEMALEENGRRIRAVLNEAPLGAHVYELRDDKLVFVGANEAADRMLKIDHSRLMGLSIEEAFPALESTEIPAIYRHVARTGERYHSEQTDYRFEGIQGVFEVHAFQTGPNRMAVFFSDVTERKRAEEAVRWSEARFRAIVASIPGAVYRCELHAPWHVEYISDGIEALSGYPASEFMAHSRTYGDLILPEDLNMVNGIVDLGIEEHKPYQVEYRIRHRNGSIRHIFEQGAATYSKDGTPLWLDGVNLDVTERKHAENALRESEKRFRLFYERMPLGYQSLDPEGRIIDVNQAWLDVLGYSKDEVIGRWFGDFLAPNQVDLFIERFPRFKASGETHGAAFDLMTKGGSRVTMSIDGKIAYDESGVVRQTHCVLSNITELERAATALREAARAKDRFLAVLSHELRNPLASIVNATHLLKMVDSNEPRFLRARSVIERAATAQARLLEDLLDVSRIALGRTALKLAPVRLDALADAVAGALAAQAGAKGLRLCVSAGEPVLVKGDETRLEQVLTNLTVNAIKYTNRGSVLITVRREAAEAVLTVRDTGIGISAEMLPQIWDVFSQADDSLAHAGGGLGLGLSLVQSFVELHGGTVSAESDGPGRGAKFTVRLPVLDRSEVRGRDTTQAPAGIEEGSPLRVLLVDDNADARETLRDILEIDRHVTFEAGDGMAALNIAARERPDVILLDIGLPEMDGYEVARRLRERLETRDALIVAVTGYGQDTDRERTASAGFDNHLTKPVDIATLRNAIRGGRPKTK